MYENCWDPLKLSNLEVSLPRTNHIHSVASFPRMLLLKNFVQKSKDERATGHFWRLLFGSVLLMLDMYTYLVNISS